MFNLNRVSSSDASVTSPVLKSLDSFTGELNSNTLVYSFYDTNLEHIPTIAMNGASSVYDGLGAFQQTKIKYVALKGTNTLKEASKFFDTPTLEKVDSENTLEFNTGDFGNNKKLKMLPKGTFINSNYSNFLTQDSNLLPTNLDLSSNNTITKLDIYGTSDYRIDGLKSLLVSNEAPFTGTSPQINVSYTGLDRDALVDLFNSMPYNVGYTVVGIPNIVDGVASGFSSSNYVKTASSCQANQITEFVVKFNKTLQSKAETIAIFPDIYLASYDSVAYLIVYKSGGNEALYPASNNISNNADCWIKYVNDGTNLYLYHSANGVNYTLDAQQAWAQSMQTTSYVSSFGSATSDIGIGALDSGSIDLNNTYIKINNILWFNGQVATTKSINITGCVGTSSLTNDDKAIVTNKGWTITE